MNAYLCLVRWADGTEGLLFPRPGNVPLATTREMGQDDFNTAKDHLLDYARNVPGAKVPITIRLIEFGEIKELASFTVGKTQHAG